MKIENNHGGNWMLAFVLAVFLFWGKPDIHDAILAWIQRQP